MSPTSPCDRVIEDVVSPVLQRYVGDAPVTPSSSASVPVTLNVSPWSGSATSPSLPRLRPEPASLTLATAVVALLVTLSDAP